MILMHFIAIQVYFEVEFSFQHLNFQFNLGVIFYETLWFWVFEKLDRMAQWYFCANYEYVNYRKLNECYRSENR